jgi:hypothetical protein
MEDEGITTASSPCRLLRKQHGTPVMNNIEQHLKDISEIRSMMERSSKVLSLSGLSGVSAGVVALSGVIFAQWIHTRVPPENVMMYLVLDALVVLALALGLSALFSARMAKKKGLPLWTNAAKYLLTDLAVPLGAGGTLCFALMTKGAFALIPGTMLVFYGLALVAASKYALKELRYFGFIELGLGILALFFTQEGLNVWAFGFGAMHIVYGLWMYFRYEK